MSNQLLSRVLFIWVTVILMLQSIPALAGNEPMKSMMQGLSRQMARVNEAIWRESYEEVAAAAEDIAKHPLPPVMDRLAMLAQIGTDASEFMQSYRALQASAVTLKEAARQERIEEVVSRYQILQQRCVACHSWYRGRDRTPTATGENENGQ